MNNSIEFPNQDSKIFLKGPEGKLEALITLAEPGNVVAVICHPHPLFGGTMNNKVIYSIARALKDLGIITIRFNFRGVEKSEGAYAEGIGESEDLVAILDWLTSLKPDNKIWLAGFSFGAYVATRVANHANVDQLITVAPAVESFNFKALSHPACPWLVIQGDQDEIVNPQLVYDWVKQLNPQPELTIIPEAGHFFHGKLVELKTALKHGLQHRL